MPLHEYVSVKRNHDHMNIYFLDTKPSFMSVILSCDVHHCIEEHHQAVEQA